MIGRSGLFGRATRPPILYPLKTCRARCALCTVRRPEDQQPHVWKSTAENHDCLQTLIAFEEMELRMKTCLIEAKLYVLSPPSSRMFLLARTKQKSKTIESDRLIAHSRTACQMRRGFSRCKWVTALSPAACMLVR